MKLRLYFLAFLLSSFIFSCNTGSENGENKQLTATVNGEDWEFYDVNVNRTGDGFEISAQGYLEGDRTSVPMNLEMTIVGLTEQTEMNTPVEFLFSPNTQGLAATATLIPVDRPFVFDTQLDPNAAGVFIINEANENTISGEFRFVATDKGGRSLAVTDGNFTDLSY